MEMTSDYSTGLFMLVLYLNISSMIPLINFPYQQTKCYGCSVTYSLESTDNIDHLLVYRILLCIVLMLYDQIFW